MAVFFMNKILEIIPFWYNNHLHIFKQDTDMYRKIKTGCEYIVCAAMVTLFVLSLNSRFSGDAQAQESHKKTQTKIEAVKDTVTQYVDSINKKTR